GNAPAFVSKIDQRRAQKRRVLVKARASNQMRLAQQVAQVIVETAGTWVSPVDNFIDAFQSFLFLRQLANLGKLFFQPSPIVQRHVDVVQVRATVHRLGLVKRNAQLHANAAKQCVRQLKDASTPLG